MIEFFNPVNQMFLSGMASIQARQQRAQQQLTTGLKINSVSDAPDQIANLYIGPLDFAPTGAAMSLVSLRSPDFEKFPRFRDALAAAQVADLGPGDAIYIPPLWWHHVESLESFNVLVNYWWHDFAGEGASADSAFDALLHGILSIRKLPPATRCAWAAFSEGVSATTSATGSPTKRTRSTARKVGSTFRMLGCQ